jgi:hypothetical protein
MQSGTKEEEPRKRKEEKSICSKIKEEKFSLEVKREKSKV